MTATVSINSQQQLSIVGVIDMDCVQDLCIQGKQLLQNLNRYAIDMSGVTDADSSCLAMMIEWIRFAKAQNKPVGFYNTPRTVLDLGRVCGVDAILPLGKEMVW